MIHCAAKIQLPNTGNGRYFLWNCQQVDTVSKAVGLIVSVHGFEPRLTESESVVLPLHHTEICGYKSNHFPAKTEPPL